MAPTRFHRALTGRRRWLAAGAAVAVLAAGGTAVAVAATDGATAPTTQNASDTAASSATGNTADTPAGTGSDTASTAPDDGQQRAVDVARRTVPGARVVSVEPDHEHGVRVWEVELRTANGFEHEVDVSRANGTVVSHSIDHDDDHDHGPDARHDDD
ncbi:PepSY domain-containing protein [Streptomyces sp. NPDC057743]|uniref:PepSY domain-containing protein n=1 Tax=Streptomyces sp. NPDC057743 TaxID=3346236 RepID=UPI0036B11883